MFYNESMEKGKNYLITKISENQARIFNNYFVGDDDVFNFEGCWLRNQRPENAKKSGFIDQTTQRRRYIHFYDSYVDEVIDGNHYLALSKYYLYVTNTLPSQEIDDYLKKIYKALELGGFKQTTKNSYVNDNNTQVIITTYDNHPMNLTEFLSNYKSLDIVVCSKDYDYFALYDRMWKLSRKMYRMPDIRENPTYVTDVKDILKYLPAQVEMGCGPSIGANIPPLYEMHETYKVQNHVSGKFYFANEDTLLFDLISNEKAMREKFAKVPLACISAQLTDGYKMFGELYKKGFFKGTVYNNNFDRLVKRMDIPEKILRIYDINEYIAKCDFDKDVKSLICMGCHADRRQVERQAREKGLKIIFIDPEGFYNKDGFEEYLVEGPKNGDLILKMTFEEAMKKLMELNK